MGSGNCCVSKHAVAVLCSSTVTLTCAIKMALRVTRMGEGHLLRARYFERQLAGREQCRTCRVLVAAASSRLQGPPSRENGGIPLISATLCILHFLLRHVFLFYFFSPPLQVLPLPCGEVLSFAQWRDESHGMPLVGGALSPLGCLRSRVRLMYQSPRDSFAL